MRTVSILICSLLIASTLADVTLVTSEFSDQAFANSEVVGWTLDNSFQDQLTSVCDQVSLFGGYNVFGNGATAVKSYDSGVDHNELYISFDLYTVDSWDNEIFYVNVDGINVYQFQTLYSTGSVRPVKCGWTNFQDRVTAVGIKIPHYRRDFKVTLTSNLNQAGNDESWGIRDLYIVASYDSTTKLVTDEFKASNFQKSTEGWEFVGVDKGKEFSECGKFNLFGGYSTFGKSTVVSKKFSNLADHFGVVVNFDLLLVDSPDGGDFVSVVVDDQIYKYYRPDWNYGETGGNLCGAGWTERLVSASIFVPHIGSEVIVSFKGNFDEGKNNESFGIQNLRVLTTYCNTCAPAAKEFTDQSFTGGEGWQVIGGADASNIVANCGGSSYFGPHKGDVQKTFTGFGPHDGLKIFFRLLTTNTWQDQTKVYAFTDGARSVVQASAYTQKKVCAKNEETVRNYFIDIPHTDSSLTLKLLLLGIAWDSAYSIRDLNILTYQNTFSSSFATQFTEKQFSKSEGWLVQGNKGGVTTSNCGDLGIFGGYNAFGSKTQATKTFSGLPKHAFAYITFQVLFIDTWDRESFVVSVDSEVTTVITKDSTWDGHQHICGWNAAKEEGYFVKIYVPHSSDTLKLTLQDYLDQDQGDESWGVRNIVVSLGDFKLPKNYKFIPAGNAEGPAKDVVDPNSPSTGNSTCIQIFTECEFAGTSLSICDSIPNLKESGWNVPVKSIKVPSGKALSLFPEASYAGEGKRFTESQNCLTGKNYLLVNKYFNIDVDEQPTRLRSQAK